VTAYKSSYTVHATDEKNQNEKKTENSKKEREKIFEMFGRSLTTGEESYL